MISNSTNRKQPALIVNHFRAFEPYYNDLAYVARALESDYEILTMNLNTRRVLGLNSLECLSAIESFNPNKIKEFVFDHVLGGSTTVAISDDIAKAIKQEISNACIVPQPAVYVPLEQQIKLLEHVRDNLDTETSTLRQFVDWIFKSW